ncbi:hypothetical protein ONM62_000149 [Escherichia coli]|uniref:hypothetical protein n=1 Tax=Enterobacteriaceae TaxID=543 RepID=UPI00038FCB4C|nr:MULTISPECIES: hypothetical protein [Enterobacteriaceae]EBY9023610.1 hypothetical protein [Salmonella enterica subsp. enterica serovar Typhimurium]EHU7578327.1 hypothetical protein [Salmonella enterica subsp. enterica serovar Alachua]MED0060993.1 hypothetical protein [Escherichia marmotae]ECD4349241.1 hypothetical protein [Salmonella enterica subsp. enterica serovar Typhimurium]EDA2473219.1 hypothetical protein [Salmonella enterica subsp. enterica serovar Typhimurium]
MDKKQLEKEILEKTQELIRARADYDSAQGELLDELKADCERSGGSMAQEARREALQEELRNRRDSAEATLKRYEKDFSELIKKYQDL